MSAALLPSTPAATPALVIATRLLLASTLGASIGFNADRRRRPAGMRLYATASLLGGLMGLIATSTTGSHTPWVLAAALLGCSFVVGLICLGLILRQASNGKATPGLTAAASLALVAVIGIAAGCGLWMLALITCALALLLLKGGGFLKQQAPRRLENPR